MFCYVSYRIYITFGINTAEIAKSMGAKVIVPDELGYGNAYQFLFEHASGDYIVMGDGDA